MERIDIEYNEYSDKMLEQLEKGVFITTADYSKGAIDFAKNLDSKIVLIDGEELAELMIDNNIGVSLEATYEIKKIDSDFFSDEW